MLKKGVLRIFRKRRLSPEEIEERIRQIEERKEKINEAKERLSEYFGTEKEEPIIEPTNKCDCNGCNNLAEFSWNGFGEKRKLCREHVAIAQAFIGFKKDMWKDLRNTITELKKNPQNLFIEKPFLKPPIL